MKMNEDKSHLLVFGNKDDQTTVTTSGSLIEESDEEELLGVTLDKKLNFKSHVSHLGKLIVDFPSFPVSFNMASFKYKMHRIDPISLSS